MHAWPDLSHETLRQARDLLIQHRLDYAAAYREFRWPRIEHFNFAETSLMIANTPGQPVVPGSMGRVMPGFVMPLRDADGRECRDGEITVSLGAERPVGLMEGYGREGGIEPISGDWYRTGDTAVVDDSGVFTYVRRADDVFKSSD